MSLMVPDYYGFVVLATGFGPLFTNVYLSGPVMAARKKFGVFYPNLYAVPGVRKLCRSNTDHAFLPRARPDSSVDV